MSLVFKAPEKSVVPENNFSIFLGGSIENGKAEFWQEELTELLLEKFNNIVILNPRRDDWDAKLTNSIDNEMFKAQVEWEYHNLEKADYILLYFQPGTLSPISLLELGLFASKSKVIVCCPEGFWRKGNVDFICQKFNIPLISSYKEIVRYIK